MGTLGQPCEEIVEQLKTQEKEIGKWFDERYDDLETIVKWSVDRNTVRALRKSIDDKGPLETFREWATDRFSNPHTLKQLDNIRTQTDYDSWLSELCENLGHYWNSQMGYTMIEVGRSAHQRKMPDLLMKWLMRWNGLSSQTRGRLIWFLHVPLDSKTIMALRDCAVNSQYASEIGKIPKSAKMGFVSSTAKYNAFQSLLRDIAESANVPPIYFDIVHWDWSMLSRHKK